MGLAGAQYLSSGAGTRAAGGMPRTLFRALLFAFFLASNVFLLRAAYFYARQDLTDESEHDIFLREHFQLLSNKEWRLPYSEGLLNCSSLSGAVDIRFVASGWTKAVYRAKIGRNSVAVKTVNLYGHDVSECLKTNGSSLKSCYKRAATKILKEAHMLHQLNHGNVVKLLGYCVPWGLDGPSDVDRQESQSLAILTELGEPLDVIKLLQTPWEDRLRLALGLSRLLSYLSSGSQRGPFSVNDFRRQQFVLVNGELKLSDVDDVTLGDPLCRTDVDCGGKETLRCIKGRCAGAVDARNTANAQRHFLNYLLPPGAPEPLRAAAIALNAAFKDTDARPSTLLQRTENLVHSFTKGSYRNSTADAVHLKGYRRLENRDLPGLHDYRCRGTLTSGGCTLSVLDAAEAAALCAGDQDCSAFVLSSQRTWTGRTLAHFKNNTMGAAKKEGLTLYVKTVSDVS